MLVAAVDLGSNSFRMVVAERLQEDESGTTFLCVPRFSLKETLRLGANLNETGSISSEMESRIICCLEAFAAKIAEWCVPLNAVRAVATHAFRQMNMSAGFLQRAEAALCVPISIISGEEEARLVFDGVMSELPEEDERRLIIDVGGGSTECVVGDRSNGLQAWVSLEMGCVSWAKRFFSLGCLAESQFIAAEHAAYALIQPYISVFKEKGWRAVYASSGTARALIDVCRTHGWTAGTQISFAMLMNIRARMIEAGSADKIEWMGLSSERVPVLAGGVVLMMALQRAFQLDRMIATEGALLMGLVWDIFRSEDNKECVL